MACVSTFRRLSRSLSSVVVLLRIKSSSLRSCVSMFCLAHWSNNRASHRGTVSNTWAVILCASVYMCLSRGGGPPTLDEWLVVVGERGTGLPHWEDTIPGREREREREREMGNNKARPLGTNSLRSVKCTTGRKRRASGLAGERVCLGGLQCAH